MIGHEPREQAAYTLLIANDFPPVTSGIATAFSEIWRRLPPGSTRILAPKINGAQQYDAAYPIPVQRTNLPLGESGYAKLAKTVLTALRLLVQGLSKPPARIHCGQVFSSGLAGLMCREIYGIPYAVWVYGSETARLAQGGRTASLMRRILRESEWVVTNSNMTSEEFVRFGVPKGKIVRVYPGVDPERFHPMERNPEWVTRWNLQNKCVLLTVARLDQRKGHDMVLRAMTHLPDDIVYLIGGTGREEERLKILASALGLSDRVRFLGFVPDEDLPLLYNHCDVFVMPNRVTEATALAGDIEGFGISFVEAGACEKPVVAGRSGGAVEAVLDGQTGLLVDPKSETDIADAIRRFLDDRMFAQQVGKQARTRIEREFDWRILARIVEDFL